jgi:hypothetical protein
MTTNEPMQDDPKMLLPLAVAGGVLGVIALLLSLGGYGWWCLLFAVVAIAFGITARGLAARAAAQGEEDATLGVKLSLSSTLLGAVSVLLLAAFAIAAGYDIGPMADDGSVVDEDNEIVNFDARTIEREEREKREAKRKEDAPGGLGLDSKSLMGE